ncbi:flippase [Planococcus sp. CAU13]|uniref:flippase n=1 Tax=Planococcus sp. CAU13 TaxID=1541197 RepID=UPI00068CE6E9|nr:flippase [Planococcus sp. CAU13]
MSKIKSDFLKLYRLANKVGFLHLLSANMLIQIAGFGGQIFLTRILSVEDIGTIKVMQSYLNILVILATFGLNTSVLKLCSEKVNEDEKKSIFSISLFISLFSSLALILGFIILNKLSLLKVDNLFVVYILLIPFLSITNIVMVYLQSQEKVKTISLIQSLSKIFIVVISTICAFWMGLNGYIYSLVILNFFTFVLILFYIRKEVNFRYFLTMTVSKTKKIFNISIFAFGSNLLGALLANGNIVIASLIGIHQVTIGYYSIAQLIITSMMIIPSTLGQIMVPKISKVSKDKLQVEEIIKKYRSRNAVLAIAISLFIGLIAPIAIPFVFGQNYSNSVLYLEILLLGFVFWSLYAPIGNTLLSVGRSDINFYVNLISVIINISLNYFLISYFGMYGAAIANTLTYFVAVFIYSYFFRKLFLKKD